MQMAINNWMHEDTILHITPLMHVQMYNIIKSLVCYSEPATKKTKYSASEQRRAMLRKHYLTLLLLLMVLIHQITRIKYKFPPGTTGTASV